MEGLISKAGDVLVGLGLAGIVILFAGVAIVALYRQNQSIQQARIDDAKAMSKIVEQNSVETKLTSQLLQQMANQTDQKFQIVISEVRNEIRQAINEARLR